MNLNKVLDNIVERYISSEGKYGDVYVYLEESGDKGASMLLDESDEEDKEAILDSLYEDFSADRNSVERQVRQEEEVFEDNYKGEGELRAKIFFALVEVVKNKEEEYHQQRE